MAGEPRPVPAGQGTAVHLRSRSAAAPGPTPRAAAPGPPPLAAPRAASTPSLGADEFSGTVAATTAMFGDPTRRRIYLAVRQAVLGVTASDIATQFGVHPNVARHHLDKLAAGGYVEVTTETGAGRSGRPSKRYRTSAKAVDLGFAARRTDLLVTLLGKALERLAPGDAAALAEEVGEAYGTDLAQEMHPGEGHRSMQAALHAVAEALTAHGFAAHAQAREEGLSIVAASCPFGDLSHQHPVVCAVDRGIVRGMLRVLHGEADPSQSATRPGGADACVTMV